MSPQGSAGSKQQIARHLNYVKENVFSQGLMRKVSSLNVLKVSYLAAG